MDNLIKRIFKKGFYTNRISFFYQYDKDHSSNFLDITKRADSNYQINETIKIFTD